MNCNLDMEALISDSNRSIATLAITTLLKTSTESSVERLLKQMTSFMSDIPDEFKIVVVEAIRTLCLKFPQKYRALMNFLSNVLREDGGFEFKKAIVDSVLILIREIPEAKEPGLAHLCEFIEVRLITPLEISAKEVSGHAIRGMLRDRVGGVRNWLVHPEDQSHLPEAWLSPRCLRRYRRMLRLDPSKLA